MKEKGSNNQLLKQKNACLIKKYIYQHSPISRVEVARALGLTVPTITSVVNDLMAQGLLHETAAVPQGEEIKGAGRPRVMLEYAADAHCICGIDLGPYRINYALTDLRGNLLFSRKTTETMGAYDRTLEKLSAEIPAFLAAAGIPMEKLLGIGIGMPGLIDGNAGKIYTTFQEGWNGKSLSRDLSRRLNTPVLTENNVRARAIAADLFERGVTDEPFAYFFVSYGIACQMIVDGQVLYGLSAAAGEIGHTVVQRRGPVCPTCGNRGCLEALAGERAVLQRCRSIMLSGTPTILRELCPRPEELTIEHICKAQEMGDPEANAVMEDVLDYLGMALANTINLISPRTVVLDGQMLNTPRNQRFLIRTVEQNMFQVHVNQIRFIFVPYNPDGGARSAAAVVVKEFLQSSN